MSNLGVKGKRSFTISMMKTNPLHVKDLVSFWDFSEPSGDFMALGPYPYRLRECDGPVERVAEGVFGTQSVRLGQTPWLSTPRAQCPALNIRGKKASLSVVAWIKREPGEKGCQAVAGMWNEHAMRQYCLFLNLGIWGSAEQVGAHVSGVGGATPGYKYGMDAAIGATDVPFGVWQCVAISYDGEYARAYLNGVLDDRGDRNPYRYPGGLFDPGPDGADFTVGAVARPETVDEDFKPRGAVIANRYHGLLGGLAIYRRALSDREMAALANGLPPGEGR